MRDSEQRYPHQPPMQTDPMTTFASTLNLAVDVSRCLGGMGVAPQTGASGSLSVRSPISGEVIANLVPHTTAQASAVIEAAARAAAEWRDVPAPRRGELIRSEEHTSELQSPI